MRNTFICLLIITFVFSGIYSCNKATPEQSPVPAITEQLMGTQGSLSPNPGALHNIIVWAYMSAKPQEQAEFTKSEVLQMTRDMLSIMSDKECYQDLGDIDLLAAEMLTGMEAMGYFNASGKLKNSQELKELPLYTDNEQPLQKVLNKINMNPASSVSEFIAAAKADMQTLSQTAYSKSALGFNSIIDSSEALIPRLTSLGIPTIFLPDASHLRIAYADAKGYTEGTKAAQDQGKNVVQQDIWGLTYSTTRSVQQLKRELGI